MLVSDPELFYTYNYTGQPTNQCSFTLVFYSINTEVNDTFINGIPTPGYNCLN